jgi:DNA-directed RNA polymerase specialized sigma24 family protein
MDLPAGTVRSHLHHARRRLRELLGELRRDTE